MLTPRSFSPPNAALDTAVPPWEFSRLFVLAQMPPAMPSFGYPPRPSHPAACTPEPEPPARAPRNCTNDFPIRHERTQPAAHAGACQTNPPYPAPRRMHERIPNRARTNPPRRPCASTPKTNPTGAPARDRETNPAPHPHRKPQNEPDAPRRMHERIPNRARTNPPRPSCARSPRNEPRLPTPGTIRPKRPVPSSASGSRPAAGRASPASPAPCGRSASAGRLRRADEA